MFFAVLRYLVYWPFNILFVALAYILSPLLAAASVIAGVTTLPGPLQWFSTLDDTLDGGQHQHAEIYPPGVKRFALWWQRTCWICRNPAHGFQSRLLGVPAIGTTIVSQGTHLTVMGYGNRIYFSFRLYSPKVWIGWNPTAYDKVGHGYEFQCNPFKKG